jgi:hypothetical protein
MLARRRVKDANTGVLQDLERRVVQRLHLIFGEKA